MPVFTSNEAEPIISTLESEASLGVIMTEHGPLPLRSVSIAAHIDQLFADVKVRQSYVNTHADAIEATYIFPLPDRAAVTRFQAKLGGRLIEGLLKERGAARQEYDEAIQQGRRAAIAEEERPNVFTMRVGNILPGEVAEIELTLCMPLAYEDGEATLRFPLVVAPRYIPGKPLGDDPVGLGTAHDTDAVPDASRITPPVLLPGYPYPVQLDIQVSLPSECTPIVNLPVKAMSNTASHTSWQILPGQKLDRDAIIRFPVARDTIVSQCVIAPDADNPKSGTLTITIAPPKAAAGNTAKPRRIVFVLDRSGSMGGWKIAAARRSLARMIDTLAPRDHFVILAFDNVAEELPASTTEGLWYRGVDAQRFHSIEALAKIDARGGTEMLQPLVRAVNRLALHNDPAEERILVLITDGQVGNEDQILKQLSSKVKDMRVFTLGIDLTVNEGFLNRFAQLSSNGTTEYVDSEDRLDEVMQRIHRRIAPPVLRQLTWKSDGINIESDATVPGKVSDLFPEAPVIILSRCTLPYEGQIHLQATDANEKPWQQALTPKCITSPVLTPCWARAKVRAMEDDYAAHGPDATNTSEMIVAHSLKYQVLSRFTAYVAIDRSEVANPNSRPREIIQAVEMPARWEQAAAYSQPLMACASVNFCRDASTDAGLVARMPANSILRKLALPDNLEVLRCALPRTEEIVLTAYRDFARQMLLDYGTRLTQSEHDARNLLLADLNQLIHAMRNAGVTDPCMQVLEELQRQLLRYLSAGAPQDQQLEQAIEAFRAFAEVETTKPDKPKSLLRKLFWK